MPASVTRVIAWFYSGSPEPGGRAWRARSKSPDFAPKKIPAQRRSRDTFEALVEACTRLLPEQGYAGTTTNHIADRAGVGIASLYEYFPGKDAIVAQVAERLVQRVLARLADGVRAACRTRLPTTPSGSGSS